MPNEPEWVNDDAAFEALDEKGFIVDYVRITHDKEKGKAYVSPEWKAEDLAESFIPKGKRVRYLDENGYDSNREYAASKGIVKDQVLTVKCTHIGNWSSDYEFEEVEGRFNTVMFREVK